MTTEITTIYSRIRIAQQKFDEARRELDDAIAMFLTYKEPAPVQQNVYAGEWLTARELAKYFRVSPGTIYEWEANGSIPKGTQFSERSRRWKCSEVEAYLTGKQRASVPSIDFITTAPRRRGRPRKVEAHV